MAGRTRAAALALGLLCGARGMSAQNDGRAAAGLLTTIESLLGWSAAATMPVDLRVMARSPLGFTPLPVVRLIGDGEGQVEATVSEWTVPPPEPVPGTAPLRFKRPPPVCLPDQSLCVGNPITLQTPEVKAMWFALIIARNCTDGSRTVLSDAEDLYVRGYDRGMATAFFCPRPQRTGRTPGERQAFAVLRIMHRLLGR